MDLPGIKVEFQGHQFWFLPDDESNNSGPLCPLHHCGKDGQLDYSMCFSGETYAHVVDGKIKRYGSVIGEIAPLLPVTN